MYCSGKGFAIIWYAFLNLHFIVQKYASENSKSLGNRHGVKCMKFLLRFSFLLSSVSICTYSASLGIMQFRFTFDSELNHGTYPRFTSIISQCVLITPMGYAIYTRSLIQLNLWISFNTSESWRPITPVHRLDVAHAHFQLEKCKKKSFSIDGI